MRRALAFALALLAPTAASALEPVTGFDADRYLGRWHEIATIPAWFQRSCAYGTTATYAPDPDPSLIRVRNACRTDDGGTNRVIGRARFKDAETTGALEVTFLRLFGSFRWFASGDYIVLALDTDYRWSAIGHPSRNYAWILAREPELDLDTLGEIEDAYAAAGYDTCELLMSPQVPGEPRPRLCDVVSAP